MKKTMITLLVSVIAGQLIAQSNKEIPPPPPPLPPVEMLQQAPVPADSTNLALEAIPPAPPLPPPPPPPPPPPVKKVKSVKSRKVPVVTSERVNFILPVIVKDKEG